MANDPNIILQAKTPEITMPDPIGQYGKALQLKSLMNQNVASNQALADDQATRQAYQNSDGTPQSVLKSLVAGGNYKAAQAVQTQLSKQGLEVAQTNKANADASQSQSAVLNQGIARHRDQLASVNDPQSAAQWVASGYQDPTTGPTLSQLMPLQDAISRIPTDPTLFAQWKQQAALGATKFIEMNKPQYQTSNLGGKTVTTALPGLGGAPTTVNSQTNSVSPDASLSAATSRANNAANIAKDYNVAGLDQSGNPSGNTQAVVDAIGQYKVAPPNGMALRNPRMQSILTQVAQQYPDFDATQYGARQTAAKAFSTGKDGQAVQSANTALNHLDTLKQLADAQGNGDIPLFNKLANRIATQSGQPAPTNLQGAITMVGPEISKAVVGAGGTGGDREKVDAALKAIQTGSPAQASGQVATMQDLFGGRLTEAQRTYERTTGRKDFSETFLSPAAQTVLASRQTNNLPTNNSKSGMALPIKTADDYNKLPSGAMYIDPTGKTRQKP